MSKEQSIRDRLISGGVRNLREFGYPSCTPENILTDEVYSQFFKSILEDNKGHGAPIDKEIKTLISEIK